MQIKRMAGRQAFVGIPWSHDTHRDPGGGGGVAESLAHAWSAGALKIWKRLCLIDIIKRIKNLQLFGIRERDRHQC